MNLLEITVQRSAAERWPVLAYAEDGEGLRVGVQGELLLDLGQLRAASMNVKAYGTVLGQALFRDEVRDALLRSRESPDGVRLLLCVEAEDLRELRWERICSPVGTRWDHVSLDQATPLTLYIPTGDDRRFPPVGKDDLRALILVASPDGLDTFGLRGFDAAAAARWTRDALAGIGCDVLGFVDDATGPPTLDTLCERITAAPYAILHLVCHGRFMRSRSGGGETVIYLCRQDGTVDAVSASRLIERLARLRGPRGLPRLIFLASCESSAADAARGGLAQRLIRELAMPAVIAMTDRISVETAGALSGAFYSRVATHGEIDRALAEATAGLAERPDITVPALYSRLRGHPLFTESLDHPLEPADLDVGLARAAALLPDRAPVLKDRFERGALVVNAIAASRSDGGITPTREDQQQALADMDALCAEAFEISFHGLALGQDPPPYDGRCPFKGLYPFGPNDREFFFGREVLTDRLMRRIKTERFLAVLGASGSGKSSLILAGLLPSLKEDNPAVFVPGTDPLRALEEALATSIGSLVVVDQFEEVFTLCPDPARQRRFITQVCDLVSNRPVVLTMRADFWGECAPHAVLRDLMQHHQELIAPMDATELRRATELQAEHVGLRFEADLVNTILDDLEGEPGSMPLLQHALSELWKRRHGRWLRTAEYRALGGVREAIARTADNAYLGLTHEEQGRVRDIFVRLTRFDEDALPGEPRRDTRRRVAFDELVPAGTEPIETRRLVARLAGASLVVTSLDSNGSADEVEVAHEALIRYWPRLRSWLEEDYARIRLREAVRRARREWEESARSDSLLTLRGRRLDEALALAEIPGAVNERELKFIEACAQLRARELAEDEAQRRLIANQKTAELLRDAAQRIAHDMASRPLEALARSVVAVGNNVRELPDEMLPPVATTLYLGVRLARERARGLGHEAAVTSVAWAPDGRLIASGSDDGVIRIRDRNAHDVVEPLRGHRGRVLSVAFSPDGSLLVSASEDRTVRLWYIGDEWSGRVLARHDDDVTAVAFGLDGSRVVSLSDDSSLRVWAMDGTELFRLDEDDWGRPSSMTLSSEGRTVVLGNDRGRMRLLQLLPPDDHGTKQEVQVDEPFGDHEGVVTSLAFAPSGDVIASAGEDGTVRLWTSGGDRVGEPYTGHDGPVMAVAFSPDGDAVASGGSDGTVRLCDRRGREGGDPLRGHTDYVMSLAFDCTGALIASGSADRTARIWDRFGHDLGRPLVGHRSHVNSVAIAPNDQVIVSGSADQHLRFWRTDGSDVREPLRAHDGFVYSVAISQDGQLVASGGADRTAKLWTIAGELFADPLPHPDIVCRVAFSPDGTRVVTACGDGNVRQWQRGGEPFGTASMHDSAALVCAFSPDGDVVVSGDLDGWLRIWDLSRDELTDPIRAHGAGVSCLAFGAAGNGFVTGGLDGYLQRWDAVGQPVGAPLKAHEGEMRCVAIHGRTIVTGGQDGTLRIWDLDGAPVGDPINAHRGTVWSVAIGNDGALLASGGADGKVRLWRGVSWRSWLRIACQRLEGHRGVLDPDADPWRSAFAVCDEFARG
jgi:WD40 repeat protein